MFFSVLVEYEEIGTCWTLIALALVGFGHGYCLNRLGTYLIVFLGHIKAFFLSFPLALFCHLVLA